MEGEEREKGRRGEGETRGTPQAGGTPDKIA